jgi:predicted O-methyltransferase YrrM
MNDLDLLIDLHRDSDRLGPGSDEMTRRALELTGLDRTRPLRVADLGCGTGASTLVLAQDLPNAHLTAVDLHTAFLERLRRRAAAAGVGDRIATRACSMDAVPPPDQPFDLIWSEGAIYTIGFADGLRAWHGLLRPGGVVVVSEITWTTHARHDEIDAHWRREYPGIATAAEKLGLLASSGYAPLAFFLLPSACWMEHYYQPLLSRLDGFLARHGHHRQAIALAEAERREVDLFRRFGDCYSYGFYLARREECVNGR